MRKGAYGKVQGKTSCREKRASDGTRNKMRCIQKFDRQINKYKDKIDFQEMNFLLNVIITFYFKNVIIQSLLIVDQQLIAKAVSFRCIVPLAKIFKCYSSSYQKHIYNKIVIFLIVMKFNFLYDLGCQKLRLEKKNPCSNM